MAIYPCEEYAEEHSKQWVHESGCLLCEVLEEVVHEEDFFDEFCPDCPKSECCHEEKCIHFIEKQYI
jgi:hypothetical protein